MSIDAKPLALRVGRAIADERQRKKMTQVELGDRIGVEKETISRFERGNFLPPLPRLAQIADALEVPIESLIRSTSIRPTDQAQVLVGKLEKLSLEDRELMLRWFCQMCDRLGRTRDAKR